MNKSIQGRDNFKPNELPARWINGKRKNEKTVSKRRNTAKAMDLTSQSMQEKKEIVQSQKKETLIFNETTKVYLDDDYEIFANNLVKWYQQFYRKMGRRLYNLDLIDEVLVIQILFGIV